MTENESLTNALQTYFKSDKLNNLMEDIRITTHLSPSDIGVYKKVLKNLFFDSSFQKKLVEKINKEDKKTFNKSSQDFVAALINIFENYYQLGSMTKFLVSTPDYEGLINAIYTPAKSMLQKQENTQKATKSLKESSE